MLLRAHVQVKEAYRLDAKIDFKVIRFLKNYTLKE